MRIICRLCVLVFSLVAAIAPVVGQQDASHPDFSGTWKLNLKKSERSIKPPLAAEPLAGETMVVTCTGLTVEIRHIPDKKGRETVLSYIVDGQPRTDQQAPQLEWITKAFWEKSSLVIVKTLRRSMYPASDPIDVVTMRWVLSTDGGTLQADVRAKLYSGSYVYDKQ
jgi:hypothetical protein